MKFSLPFNLSGKSSGFCYSCSLIIIMKFVSYVLFLYALVIMSG